MGAVGISVGGKIEDRCSVFAKILVYIVPQIENYLRHEVVCCNSPVAVARFYKPETKLLVFGPCYAENPFVYFFEEVAPVISVRICLDGPFHYLFPVIFRFCFNRHVYPIPATLKCGINREQRLIGSIHGSEDVKIGRQLHPAPCPDIGIGDTDSRECLAQVLLQIAVGCCPVCGIAVGITVEQLKYVSEYLGTVSSVDFLDYQIDRPVQIAPGPDIGIDECLRSEFIGNLAIIAVFFPFFQKRCNNRFEVRLIVPSEEVDDEFVCAD